MDGSLPVPVIFLNVGVVVMHLGVIGQTFQSGPLKKKKHRLTLRRVGESILLLKALFGSAFSPTSLWSFKHCESKEGQRAAIRDPKFYSHHAGLIYSLDDDG